jgi:hypothetical protein
LIGALDEIWTEVPEKPFFFFFFSRTLLAQEGEKLPLLSPCFTE